MAEILYVLLVVAKDGEGVDALEKWLDRRDVTSNKKVVSGDEINSVVLPRGGLRHAGGCR
jgi:hypothetical protein